MPDHDLHSFMAQITNEMGSEYDRIYARAAQDPGTAGDEGEENWARLFKEWLPPAYHVETKGRLIGHDGRMSPQIDVVVLKPAYPRKLLEKKIWLAGGVAAAFECKTTITAAHVTASIIRCAEFKGLYAPREGSPRVELRSPLIYGLLAHSHSWKGEKSKPIENIQSALEATASKVAHPRLEMDVLCVADLATWSKMLISRYEAAWNPDTEAELTKVFGAACGPMTAMSCSSHDSASQDTTFRPVGALLNDLTRQIAWADPNVRDIADYFRLANLGGSGSGSMRPWPLSTYSSTVAREIAAGRLSNGVPWDEWSIGGL
ncbi:hypothetical protein GCM10017083_09450 [Thalassobaculum fulvum]|uniref:DUF6602 domain-containing protein n=1 Tax=Thalassobaculum fulvum TaxID=1633335 RepID=A0A918XQE8_9PROT|nr:DUF6602 domain-containing protein [Thalassobaculum fulvum]GHD43381.1 hypothetical protein GCM10017083_09450 [Thalassobaculum fulvum]